MTSHGCCVADELEAQVHDLQQVNETTVNTLTRTEQELKELKIENEALRKSRNRKLLELEEEVQRYRDQVSAIETYNLEVYVKRKCLQTRLVPERKHGFTSRSGTAARRSARDAKQEPPTG